MDEFRLFHRASTFPPTFPITAMAATTISPAISAYSRTSPPVSSRKNRLICAFLNNILSSPVPPEKNKRAVGPFFPDPHRPNFAECFRCTAICCTLVPLSRHAEDRSRHERRRPVAAPVGRSLRRPTSGQEKVWGLQPFLA
jgi:hypothetical protein